MLNTNTFELNFYHRKNVNFKETVQAENIQGCVRKFAANHNIPEELIDKLFQSGFWTAVTIQDPRFPNNPHCLKCVDIDETNWRTFDTSKVIYIWK